MSNRTPEQDLIDQFVDHLKNHSSDDLRICDMINYKCGSKKHADVEFKSESNLHWVIEAKSDDSSDRYNTVHKIFGELLKETGRNSRDICLYAILLPSGSVQFYSHAFQSIRRDKFIGFGDLIPIKCVFTCDAEGINQISWADLYDAHQP